MNRQLMGILLLVGGGILLYFGWQEKESVASEVAQAVEGTPTDRSMWMLGGGAVLAVAGLVVLVKRKPS